PKTLDQPHRLGIEAERLSRLVERLDAREQIAVQRDSVAVRGKLRRELGLYLLPPVVRIRADKVEENGRRAIEQPAGALESDDRVLERRRLAVRRNRVDLGELLGHAALERRGEVLVLDPVERRILKGQGARRE